MLNWALKYLNLGLSVIPLRPLSKEPLIPWQEFQKRRANQTEVRKWFANYPQMNLGIVTGAISNIAVIDLDGFEGIAEAKKLGITSCIESLTGNGKHLWYRYPNSNVRNAVKVLPGIDIRGDGGFIVAPPSVHENGKRYRWITQFNQKLLPEFPIQIIATSVISDTNTTFQGKKESWIAKALEEMKDGNIDNTFTSILGRMRHDGWSSADARALLLPHAERVGAATGHLEEKIENIWNRYESNQSKIQREMRLHESGKQSLFLSTDRRGHEGLIIHSPTNPDSIKQFEQLSLATNNESYGSLQSGYPKLDALCFGGLKSSRLFTVAARTGTGKTNWLIGVIRTLCEAGKRVLLFSTETPYSEIWDRYLATLKEPEKFKQHSFFICDSFAPNLEKVEEAINEIKPDLFIFDHVNHIGEDHAEVGNFMQGLNYLRRKYDCAGIVAAQLNRNADWIDLKTGEKVTPRMSMIKSSGTIEQASSRVLLLAETRVTPEGTEITGTLDKNDNGPKGMCHFILRSNPYRMEGL